MYKDNNKAKYSNLLQMSVGHSEFRSDIALFHQLDLSYTANLFLHWIIHSWSAEINS